METIEIRAWIKDFQTTINHLEGLGCVFKGTYSFKDQIYHPKKKKYDLDQEFMRLRVYEVSNWNQKNVQLIHKKKIRQNLSGNALLRLEFENPSEGEAFLNQTHDLAFAASRQGVEYTINHIRIFVEKIEHLESSIEVLGSSEEEVMSILKAVEYVGLLAHSVPKTVELKLKKHTLV